jgi:ligand-binding sensor domain-containing protein
MGLDRYDGTRIKIFSGDDLPSTYIFTLCEDKRGNIWIGTGKGIAVYDYEHDRIFEPKMADGTRLNLAIYSITCNSSGEIWFDARKDVLF